MGRRLTLPPSLTAVAAVALAGVRRAPAAVTTAQERTLGGPVDQRLPLHLAWCDVARGRHVALA